MYLDICILASDYLTSLTVHCLMTWQASPCSFKLICHILRVLSFDPVANHLPSGENAQQTTYLEINAPTQGDEPQSFTQQTFKGPSVTTTWFISEQIKDKTTEGIFFVILLIPRTFQFRKLNWRALKIWQTLWDMTRVESYHLTPLDKYPESLIQIQWSVTTAILVRYKKYLNYLQKTACQLTD